MILVGRVNMLCFLSHLHVRSGLYTDEDVSPHPAFRMPTDGAKILMRSVLVRLYDHLFCLQNSAFTRRKLGAAGGFRYTGR